MLNVYALFIVSLGHIPLFLRVLCLTFFLRGFVALSYLFVVLKFLINQSKFIKNFSVGF